MKLGDRGSDGKQVQGRLIEVGYDLGPLGADGIPCEATWKALEELAAARDPA